MPRNYAEAVELFLNAVFICSDESYFQLGLCYAEGKGVPRSDFYALAYFELAAKYPVKGAAAKRDELRGRMTPAQIAEAQALMPTLSREGMWAQEKEKKRNFSCRARKNVIPRRDETENYTSAQE